MLNRPSRHSNRRRSTTLPTARQYGQHILRCQNHNGGTCRTQIKGQLQALGLRPLKLLWHVKLDSMLTAKMHQLHFAVMPNAACPDMSATGDESLAPPLLQRCDTLGWRTLQPTRGGDAGGGLGASVCKGSTARPRCYVKAVDRLQDITRRTWVCSNADEMHDR